MIEYLPTVNAVLNSLSAFCLLLGLYFIKKGSENAHRMSMIGALSASSLFLISYVTHHFLRQSLIKTFPGEGAIKTFYYFILGSHSILAAIILPLVIITVMRALKGNFEKHKKIARWTFPIWLYVSVTGVAVYWMLYRMY